MDRAIFFSHVRGALFGGRLTQAQVEGTEALLDAAAASGLGEPRRLAYVLATAFHETGRAMQPVREIGKGKGRAYGQPDPVTGQTYYGRGLVQITWKVNYRRLGARLGVDLVNQPDKALEPKLSAQILVTGMLEGLFTGRALDDFFSAEAGDWEGARRIVNGTDKAREIAAFARSFHSAIEAAQAASHSTARSAGAAAPESSRLPKELSMKGYRTIAFNAVIALVGVAQSVDWVSILGSERAGVALALVALANMVLRKATDSPVGGARPAAEG